MQCMLPTTYLSLVFLTIDRIMRTLNPFSIDKWERKLLLLELLSLSACYLFNLLAYFKEWPLPAMTSWFCENQLKSILIQFVNLCELIISILSLYGICVHYEENCKFW